MGDQLVDNFFRKISKGLLLLVDVVIRYLHWPHIEIFWTERIDAPTFKDLSKNFFQASPGPLDDNLPRTSSCGSHDNPDGPDRDLGSNEGSYLTDDSDLDLIPEKESPEMLWSPEEIEMKKFESAFLSNAFVNVRRRGGFSDPVCLFRI